MYLFFSPAVGGRARTKERRERGGGHVDLAPVAGRAPQHAVGLADVGPVAVVEAQLRLRETTTRRFSPGGDDAGEETAKPSPASTVRRKPVSASLTSAESSACDGRVMFDTPRGLDAFSNQ